MCNATWPAACDVASSRMITGQLLVDFGHLFIPLSVSIRSLQDPIAKMLFSIEPPARLLVVLLSTTSLATFFYPSPQTSLLEHILVDTHGAHSSGFADAITPCSNYVSGAQTLGRETAAQWVRVSFHDFVTAHVADGTGGVDASIGFETSSVENSGAFVNDTLGFFRHWVSSKVSREGSHLRQFTVHSDFSSG